MIPPRVQLAYDAVFAHADGGTFAAVLSDNELVAFGERCIATGVVVRQSSFKECQKAGVLLEWARVLGFPDYYGKNWDAFDECLCDREITPRVATLLIVRDARQFLRSEGTPLLDILERVSNGRSDSNYSDPSWVYPSLWIVLNFEKQQHIDDQLAGRDHIWRISRE